MGKATREGELPLSFAQQRLWFLDHLEPGRAVYNVPLPARLRGPLSVAALTASCNEIARRHEVLRTNFVFRQDRPVQIIAPELDLTPRRVDLRNLPVVARETELERLAAAEAGRPFDLAREPLVRAILVPLHVSGSTGDTGDEHAFLLTLHHSITDGWSLGVFLRELSLLYAALLDGRPAALPVLPVQYADFAVWQRRWLTDEVLERQLDFWRGRLSGAPPFNLPTDRPRPAIQTFRGATESLLLPAGLVSDLRHAAGREGATLFMLFLAGFQALLARWSGVEDVVVGTPVANRGRFETEALIGLFVNTLVLRTDLSGEPGFLMLLGRVREVALAAYVHQDLPFERLVEELAPDRSLGRTPLFQIMFAVHGGAAAVHELPGIALTVLESKDRQAKFDLGFSAVPRGAQIELSLNYNVDLFDAVRMRRMLDHLARLLAAAMADPRTPYLDLPLAGEGERHQILVEWNATGRAWGAAEPSCLSELPARWAAATPDAVAVVAGEEQLTYGELAVRTRFLARRLSALGVGPEVLVGILAEPSLARVTAVLAVLTAGGAFVALDPDHPTARTAHILAAAAPRIVLADHTLLDRLPAVAPGSAAVTVLPLLPLLPLTPVADAGDVGKEPAASAPALPQPEPEALAYVIHTSGSTGVPNGVMVGHGAAVNLVLAARASLDVLPGDRISHLASFGFDAAVLEVFLALASGGVLVVGRREERVPGSDLTSLLARSAVQHLVMTPSVLALLPAAQLPALQTVSMGGESCPPEVASRWAGRVTLVNCYGPTETAIYSTSFPCVGVFTQEPAIGRPVANTQAGLLDRHLRPVTLGTPGELCIGGVGLARGYLSRPDLTAERFVPDPFGRSGCRVYRTGDLAHHRPDGRLEFLGRIDQQVKIRGLRIELGEIEVTLRAHAAVRDAAVAVAGEGEARRLIAYIVPVAAEGEALRLADALREHLGQRLPSYMVPASFLLLDALPLTPTGKLDRRSLPAPDWRTESELVPARNPLEAALVDMWREILGIERVGVRDGFFQLGGHSLLAAQLISRVRGTFQVELPLRSLFDSPTVEALAAEIEAAETRPGQSQKIARVLGKVQEAAREPRAKKDASR